MFRVLTQPYPISKTFKSQIWVASIISSGVFFLLFVFQPFGLDRLPVPLLYWLIIGYTAVCFITMMANYLIIKILFPRFFTENTWKVYKEILWILWTVLIVSLANGLYGIMLGRFELGLPHSFDILFITFVVAIAPVSLMVILKHNLLLKKNLRLATQLNQNLQQYHHHTEITNKNTQSLQITFKSDEKKGELTIDLDSFFYAQASDNYLEIYYLKNEKLQKALLRNTLKNIEMDFAAFPQLFRCHRSFLINLNNIKKVEGNSQGYKLTFEKTDFQVPVARNLAKVFKEKIRD